MRGKAPRKPPASLATARDRPYKATLLPGAEGAAGPVFDDLRHRLSRHRSGIDPDRSVRHTLVRSRLPRRAAAGLVVCALARQALASAGSARGNRRFPGLGDAGRGARRPAWLCPVLPARLLPRHPLAALQLWHGGMSFHGGLLGVVVAGVTFCARRRIKTLAFADLIFCAAPIGLFLGRVANFINGELVGRPSDVPWAMVFPGYGPQPRHPSQLYEAGLEGAALFLILFLLWRVPVVRERPGMLTGAFLIGYGLCRIFVELFRTPDAHLGFLMNGLTMGQLLSIPMLLVGVWFVVRAARGNRSPA